MKKNLAAILDRAQARGSPGDPGRHGSAAQFRRRITRAHFARVYADLAKEYSVRFIPFLLQGVAGDATLNQADGIHPNVRGAEMVADMVWKELEPALRRPNWQPKQSLSLQ